MKTLSPQIAEIKYDNAMRCLEQASSALCHALFAQDKILIAECRKTLTARKRTLTISRNAFLWATR